MLLVVDLLHVGDREAPVGLLVVVLGPVLVALGLRRHTNTHRSVSHSVPNYSNYL